MFYACVQKFDVMVTVAANFLPTERGLNLVHTTSDRRTRPKLKLVKLGQRLSRSLKIQRPKKLHSYIYISKVECCRKERYFPTNADLDVVFVLAIGQQINRHVISPCSNMLACWSVEENCLIKNKIVEDKKRVELAYPRAVSSRELGWKI